MAFEGLSSRLQEITRKLSGKARVSESDLKEVMREVKFALLDADVNFKIVKDFIKVIEEKALGQDVLKSLTPGQQVVKIVRDELVELLGGEDSKVNFSPNPPTQPNNITCCMIHYDHCSLRSSVRCINRFQNIFAI